MTTFNRYQNLAVRTAAKRDDPDLDVAILALGLAGEAGETADMIKKWIGHGHEVDGNKLVRELGDVLWYIAVLANAYSIDLDLVAEVNIAKLRERFPSGFSTADSIARRDAA